jgi:hypothetical protein
LDSAGREKKRSQIAGSEDVRRLFGDIDDHSITHILALKPTIAELEEAAARVAGAGDVFADVRPAEGVVAKIVELISRESEEAEERR